MRESPIIKRRVARSISGGSKYSEPLYLPIAKRLGVERILAKPAPPTITRARP
jgi:hypothetical protein